MTTKLRYCLNAVSCLGNEDHVRLGFDNHDETLAKDRMIFDTEDANSLVPGHDAFSAFWRSVRLVRAISQHLRQSIVPADSAALTLSQSSNLCREFCEPSSSSLDHFPVSKFLQC